MFSEQDAARREQLIQDYYDACEVQDWNAISSFLHPQVTFRVANGEPTRSVDALKAKVAPLLQEKEVTRMKVTVDSCVHDASGRRTAAEIHIQLKRANGREYEGPGCGIFDFADDGSIVAYHAYVNEGGFWL